MTAASSTETTLQNLPLDALRESGTNPRKHFDQAALDELASTIRQNGLQQPMLVRYLAEDDVAEPVIYEIVAGARRFRACKLAGLDTAPCIVRELTDAQAREIQIIENLQREGVHAAEEAEAFQKLIDDGRSPIDIAKQIGKEVSYVAKRLKLLELSLDCKLLFVKGHLALDHVLLLATLTHADQERALYFMFDVDPKQTKRTIAEIIRGRLMARGDIPVEVAEDDPDFPEEEDEEDGDALIGSGAGSTPKVAKYMHEGRRVIDATPAQLKRWITGNVLLLLANAPFRLNDDDLVKSAGACDVCPKRSGSNAALFSDLTVAEDICLDPACYAEKQTATMKERKAAVKASGGQLLKISAKNCYDALEEPAVRKSTVGMADIITRKTVRQGQWVAAEAKSCADTIEALMVDGPDKGAMMSVCANQKCKVHAHTVYARAVSGTSSAPSETPEKKEARLAAEKKAMDAENEIRRKVRNAILPKLTTEKVMQRVIASLIHDEEADLCDELGLAFPIEDGADEWERNDAARPMLEKHVFSANLERLMILGLEVLIAGSARVSEGWIRVGQPERGRDKLWRTARAFGIDADAIARGARKAVVKSKAKPKKSVAKKAAKAPVAKKLTPQVRKKIAATVKVGVAKKLARQAGRKVVAK